MISDIVTELVAHKHRLLRERDELDRQIAAIAQAITAIQEVRVETTPEAPHPEVQQPEATVQQVPPAAPKPYVTRPAAATTGKKPTPAKSAAAQPISYHDLMARAAEWGITEINPDALLAAVNAKAVRIGHKPYALQSRSP